MVYITDGGKTAASAIAFCKAQLGKPYRWGATGPSAFDCSGLLFAAFNAAGFKGMTRTTVTQIRQGDPVANDAAGDLWFPDFGHVGISLGDGTIIHAPTTGDVVKISRKWKNPVAIRRIVEPTNSGSTIPANANGFVSTGLNDTLNPFTSIFSAIEGFASAISWIASPHNWLRVGMAILGVLALGVALWMVAT